MSVKRHKKLYAATPHNDLLEIGRVEHIYFRPEHTYFGLEHRNFKFEHTFIKLKNDS